MGMGSTPVLASERTLQGCDLPRPPPDVVAVLERLPWELLVQVVPLGHCPGCGSMNRWFAFEDILLTGHSCGWSWRGDRPT
jgi:hypothetical protein